MRGRGRGYGGGCVFLHRDQDGGGRTGGVRIHCDEQGKDLGVVQYQGCVITICRLWCCIDCTPSHSNSNSCSFVTDKHPPQPHKGHHTTPRPFKGSRAPQISAPTTQKGSAGPSLPAAPPPYPHQPSLPTQPCALLSPTPSPIIH